MNAQIISYNFDLTFKKGVCMQMHLLRKHMFFVISVLVYILRQTHLHTDKIEPTRISLQLSKQTRLIIHTFEKFELTVEEEVVEVEDVDSCFPHPGPPGGTKGTDASVPLCSDFKEGKFAGALRALGTFPKLCMPCL
jgi:hypothetical protein